MFGDEEMIFRLNEQMKKNLSKFCQINSHVEIPFVLPCRPFQVG